MDHGWAFLGTAALSNQSSKAMGVANAGGFFDGARDIVVGVAKLVRQQLDLVRGGFEVVVHDFEFCWCTHALLGSDRDQVELVGVFVSHHGVDDSASHRVLEVVHRTIEDPSVDALAADHVHELGLVLATDMTQCCFDLLDLWQADALLLPFADAIAVEDDLLRVAAVHSFETLQRSEHACLQRGGRFLADLVLRHRRAPVGGCMLIH